MKTKTKIKIFNWLWYRIFRNIIRSKKTGGPERRHKQFVFMLKWAKRLKVPISIFFGDSEVSTFDTYAVMKEFSGCLVLNFGVPGSVAYEWTNYWKGIGAELYEQIKGFKQAISIGGNYSLRSLMNIAEQGMKELHDMFPNSWILIIPPVYDIILGMIQKTKEQWDIEIETIRGYQRKYWSPEIIDTYSPFVDKNGEPLPGVLKDLVHFATRCVKIIEVALDIAI